MKGTFKNIRQRLNINREDPKPRRFNRGCPNCGDLDHEDPKACFKRPRAIFKTHVGVKPLPENADNVLGVAELASKNSGCSNCGDLDHEGPKACFKRPRAIFKTHVGVKPLLENADNVLGVAELASKNSGCSNCGVVEPLPEDAVHDNVVGASENAVPDNVRGVANALTNNRDEDVRLSHYKEIVIEDGTVEKYSFGRISPPLIQKKLEPLDINKGFESSGRVDERVAWGAVAEKKGDQEDVPDNVRGVANALTNNRDKDVRLSHYKEIVIEDGTVEKYSFGRIIPPYIQKKLEPLDINKGFESSGRVDERVAWGAVAEKKGDQEDVQAVKNTDEPDTV